MRSDVFHKKSPPCPLEHRGRPRRGCGPHPFFAHLSDFFFLTRTPDKHKINRYFFQQDQTLMEGSTWQ